MADVHSKEIRSYNMSRIKSKDTKPELLVRKFLHKNGFRYRLHVKDMPGKPDIVLPKYKTVIFIHGCFWHGHEGCKLFRLPKSNSDWWSEKINKNSMKDERTIDTLIDSNWRVVVVWECELVKRRLAETITSIISALKKSSI
ncbi:DNA mismatch endonuclease (patch repair protein) [Mucilaginibacter rubeus]|uniref:very short patch repair endonuclease n=1 Tax=Mucilaginibacter rubeus TaxID=2027860 RepID=UPI0033985A91